jgi:hypothetical protein
MRASVSDLVIGATIAAGDSPSTRSPTSTISLAH